MTFQNVWLMWKRVTNEKKSLPEFKEELGLALCASVIPCLSRGRKMLQAEDYFARKRRDNR